MPKVTGFTLVEILVVLAITSLMTAGMINFMISQGKSYSLQEDLQEMEQNARAAMDVLAKKLQDANEVSVITTDDNTNDKKLPIIDIDGDTYYFKFRTGDPTRDDVSERIGRTNDIIASFIQDVNGDNIQDVPLFRADADNQNVVTLTVVARTRHMDPGYTGSEGALINFGYRRIVLTKRVVLRNKL